MKKIAVAEDELALQQDQTARPTRRSLSKVCRGRPAPKNCQEIEKPRHREHLLSELWPESMISFLRLAFAVALVAFLLSSRSSWLRVRLLLIRRIVVQRR